MAFLAIAAGFLTGCSKDNIGEPETVSSENDAVLISPGVDASPTNAAEIDGPINNPGEITALPLYFLRGDYAHDTWSGDYYNFLVEQIPATADLSEPESINVTFGESQYYSLDGTNTLMVAWYPKADEYLKASWGAPSVNATWNLDGTKDVMVSNPLIGNKDDKGIDGWEVNRFQLEHKLAQVELYAYAESQAESDYWGTVKSIKLLDQKDKLTVTVQPTYTDVESQVPIVCAIGSSTSDYNFREIPSTTALPVVTESGETAAEKMLQIAKPILIPPIAAGEDLVFEIETSNREAKEYTFTVPVQSTDGILTDGIQAGYKYRLNLKFGLSGVILDPDADEWGKPIDVVYDLGTTGGEEAAYPYFVEGENYIVSRDILGGILTFPVHDKWTALPDEYTADEDGTVAAILEVDAADGTSALNHDGAALYCSTKGAGWRLPTTAELELIKKHQSKLDNTTYGNNFTQLSGYYWSWNEDVPVQIGETSTDKKVRCVRDI